MKTKHCTKCTAFAWWEGDFCCTKRMSIMEGSVNGKFWAILPEAFNADKCDEYELNEHYNSDPHEYYPQYIEFLKEEYKEDLSEDELIIKYGYKNYKKQ